ncbi:unnamed protein product [Rotaria sp. Silwood2]|nr:unnamed protein product [Rotaria sp. Silwood2]
MSRSSTTNRILHRTLPSRYPSPSTIGHCRRESSTQSQNRLRKSTSSSTINKNFHSPTALSSINNSRFNKNLPDGDELEMESDIVSVDVFSTQNQTTKENANPIKYPFEIDKDRLQKKTTLSGKKLADEIIKQIGRGTDNLRSHLLVHGLKNFAFESQEEQRILVASKTSISQVSSTRKRQIDQAILKCTIEAGLPFCLFNHDALIELLDILEPGYKSPDRRTLSLRTQDQYFNHIVDLKSILPHIGPISFTSDLWKDVSGQHIISLSLHTFSIDFDFVSMPISFHRFTEQKLSINIKKFFEYERERFGLSTSILAGLTTDNGPDIKAASASGVLGPRYACLAHCLNLVVHHGTCVWEMPNAKRYPFDTMFEPVSSSLIDDEDDEMTNEIPSYTLFTSIDDIDGLSNNSIQPSNDYFAFDSIEDSSPNEKPISNEDIFNFLIRIHRLIQKVRTFVP